MTFGYPHPPHLGGKLTSRLTRRNWRSASLLRRHPRWGLIRVIVVGMRYWDRGAGGFMAGGAWVYEGRVLCRSYPAAGEERETVPAYRSKARWGFEGEVPLEDGSTLVMEDPPARHGTARHPGTLRRVG